MTRIRTVLLALTTFLVTGCTPSTSDSAAPDTGSPAPSSTGSTGSTGSTAPATPAPHTVSLGDADRGRTVPVAAGDQVVITLASTYWRFTDPNPPAILVPTGAPT